MWSAVFYLLLIVIPQDVLGGFNSGAPCSSRNTAVLDIRGIWKMPRNTPMCIDISSAGNALPSPAPFDVSLTTTLYADHMRASIVPYFFLVAIPRLELIDLSGNFLRVIFKDVFLPLRNLRTLLLANNNVRVPKRMPLLNSKSLQTLSLSGNGIRRLQPHTFAELASLTVLYLDHNDLAQLPFNVFEPLKSLKYLHLGNNRLKVVPYITLMATPRPVVILKGNPFEETDIIKR